MTKTTAEVKRYKHIECSCNDCMIASETGTFVLATDYATLQQRCLELEAALAAAAVKVSDEVLEAAHGIDQMTPQMPFDTFLKQQRLICNFVLQLAGKDGGRDGVP